MLPVVPSVSSLFHIPASIATSGRLACREVRPVREEKGILVVEVDQPAACHPPKHLFDPFLLLNTYVKLIFIIFFRDMSAPQITFVETRHDNCLTNRDIGSLQTIVILNQLNKKKIRTMHSIIRKTRKPVSFSP